jgi:DNA-binding FadR family transcriptional regulator
MQGQTSERLYSKIARQIAARIRTGGYAVGQRLPGEIDLASELGVSRPTVREALIALEIAGQVEIRGGSGSYVRAVQQPGPLMMDAGPAPFELLKARMLIECEIAGEAAIQASAADLLEIEDTLREMRVSIAAGENSRNADRRFHLAIAQSIRNSVVSAMVDGLWSGMFSPMFNNLSLRTGLDQHQRGTLRDHQEIFEAISARDAGKARSSMRRHLSNVEKVLLAEDDGVVTTEKQKNERPNSTAKRKVSSPKQVRRQARAK